ncbi:hypothetical protein FACS1894199_07970 [Bacteroidia bacterium]|nr:hypothetical protein FACS1894199_07970 [Bacteroidia bacterium]
MNKTSSTQATFEDIRATLDRTAQLHEETAQRQKAFEKQQEKNAAKADKRREKDAAEFKEYVKQQKKEAAEAEKRREEESAEWHARCKKIDERLASIGENLGGLGLRIGGIMETLLAARSWEKFKAYNYGFERVYQRVRVYNGKILLTDIDILLSNGKYVMAVEVKNTLNRIEYVDDHVKRMEKIMHYPPAEVKGKKVMGAMACGVVVSEVRDYAFSKGLFVLELTGDAADLATPPANFTPQEWIPM